MCAICDSCSIIRLLVQFGHVSPGRVWVGGCVNVHYICRSRSLSRRNLNENGTALKEKSVACQCVTQAALLHILLQLMQPSHLCLSSLICYIPPLTPRLPLNSLKLINVEKDIF